MKGRTVLIVSASSDIGEALMRRYLEAGATVIGTHRRPGALEVFASHPRAHILDLDLLRPERFPAVVAALAERGLTWDIVIFANGTMEPIGPFLELDGANWQASIAANALLPCRLLQQLYPFRRETEATVAFFAGGGTNNPFTNYSAYCLSKIILIKMCELLDDEAPDLKTFIIGPGYVRTKIHEETFRAGAGAGANLQKAEKFLQTEGTPMQDIFECIEWCAAQPRAVIGGRNISVVHDPWREGEQLLARELGSDPDKFKLRRHGNRPPAVQDTKAPAE